MTIFQFKLTQKWDIYEYSTVCSDVSLIKRASIFTCELGRIRAIRAAATTLEETIHNLFGANTMGWFTDEEKLTYWDNPSSTIWEFFDR